MTYEALWHRLIPLYDTGEAKAIVRWVLDECFGLSLTDILCDKMTELHASDLTELEEIMCRLEKAEPVQYVLGTVSFCGRSFHVEPGVLIPRPETEELCRWITSQSARHFVSRQASCEVLDIGTGSGCIAITLAAEITNAKVSAWDISDEALRVAQQNAKAQLIDVTFEKHDALNPPEDIGRWDIIVSNPPYIDETKERDKMAKNVLDYEPHIALFGPAEEPDRFYRCIGDYAIRSLKTGGSLYFELNPLTAETVAAYLRRLGFHEIEVREDQYGKNRFLQATKI